MDDGWMEKQKFQSKKSHTICWFLKNATYRFVIILKNYTDHFNVLTHTTLQKQ